MINFKGLEERILQEYEGEKLTYMLLNHELVIFYYFYARFVEGLPTKNVHMLLDFVSDKLVSLTTVLQHMLSAQQEDQHWNESLIALRQTIDILDNIDIANDLDYPALLNVLSRALSFLESSRKLYLSFLEENI